MITVNRAECQGCGVCMEHCPRGAIELIDGTAHIDHDRCNDCGTCMEVCPCGAITRAAPVVTPPREIVLSRPAQPVQTGRLAAAGATLLAVGAQALPHVLDLLNAYLARRVAVRQPQGLPISGGAGIHRRRRMRQGRRNRRM